MGSIYFNYVVTSLIDIAVYVGLCVYFGEVQTGKPLLAALVVFSVLFPMWFFRYARSLWLGFDHYWDPTPEDAEFNR